MSKKRSSSKESTPKIALSVQEELSSNTAIFARDIALAQLRTAVILLRNTSNSVEQMKALKIHIERLLDLPDETLWVNYIAPVLVCEETAPVKARHQFSIIKESLLLLGIKVDSIYVDKTEEKSWFLDWNRARKARLFWTKSTGWSVVLYLGQGDSHVHSGFNLDDFLTQIGVDKTWWHTEW